jgi:hypothetical protein
MENIERRNGTIRRWTSGFGFCNSYNERGELERFFVHPTNKAVEMVLEFGVRISFTPGSARNPKECRVALAIEPYEDEAAQ